MWQRYVNAETVKDAITILEREAGNARIVAGATDLMLELERGQKPQTMTLIDISRIPDLSQIVLDEQSVIHLGPAVTHNHCVGSKLIRDCAVPLAQATWEVGSPQIRNRGTVAGNLITASPANDTITPLMALGAKVRLKSAAEERTVALEDFYTGVRKTVMRPDEMLVDISFPALRANQKGIYIKYALRQAQAISVVNLAAILEFEEEMIASAMITLGAVAPTIIHAREAEQYLVGKKLTVDTIQEAARKVQQAARPIDDLRGSAKYRRKIVEVVAARALKAIAANTHAITLPQDPVLLWGKDLPYLMAFGKQFDQKTPINTRINGKAHTFKSGQNKSLLRLLREEGYMVGVKEGCAEGECGACTVYLDGQAVMSCMVPAPRADGAEIVTVEGIARKGKLHPVQKAFIDVGAVQCGYCTPGLIMSTVKLLEEKTYPNRNQIQQAITGNLCRCTGYYKIIEAVEQAAEEIHHG